MCLHYERLLPIVIFLMLLGGACNNIHAAEPALSADDLHRDWMQQDYGKNDVSSCFISHSWNLTEQKMVDKVLKEMKALGGDTKSMRQELQSLDSIPANDPKWKALYFKACQERRKLRLAGLREVTPSFFFIKNAVIGGSGNIEPTFFTTDNQTKKKPMTWKPGAKLCRLTIQENGATILKTLLEQPRGSIRDPELSFDAQTLLFSMRDNYDKDDYDLFSMSVTDLKPKQITHTPVQDNVSYPVGNIEPCFLPNGRILYVSTRCAQLDPCSWSQTGNLYTCLPDGSDIQRMGFDQVNLLYPKVLNDGRVLYTRWEYNDRNPIFIQPLFVMNEDGTNQTEYYGNNSWWPVSILHGRGIPGSSKVIAIASGHHTLQKGKLILINRTEGTQEGAGSEFLAGASPDGSPGRKKANIHETKKSHQLDGFGQAGFQFAYPYPLDEEEFLVSFTPDGYQGFVRWREYLYENHQGRPFGVYWMNAEGNRELLAFDPNTNCLQAIPQVKRAVPPSRPSTVDYRKKSGTFYVQDIYQGPGLKDIPRDMVKRMRVVALEYRAAFVGSNRNDGPGGDSCAQTPIGTDNASWDIKHILGEVDIEKDGSVFLEVPALSPVYFQMLDEKGKMVQSMRSWTMLMPGEQIGCLGCHENKLDTGESVAARKTTLAMRKPAQKLKPFAGSVHPFIQRLEKEGLFDSLDNYLGVNRPKTFDENVKTEGFSYPQSVQPILDRHCIACHDGNKKNDG